MSIVGLTDSYKVSHWKQYPPNTTKVYSYFAPRNVSQFDDIRFFGLQYFISTYLTKRVLAGDVKFYKQLFEAHFGRTDCFNEEGWNYIVDELDGLLPICIEAVPEGGVYPKDVPLFVVYNTDPKCAWLTCYLETLLSQLWYSTTVCTISYAFKKLIDSYLEKTSDQNSDFSLHDFGFRGVSSVESAKLGGAAHLLNFKGTDTLVALEMIQRCYDPKYTGKVHGFSVPATEHSSMTSWGKENEAQAYENFLDQFPDGIVACVSDSYNIYHACEKIWGEQLKDKVVKRKGKLVIRPDSGDPTVVVLKCLEILGKKFGFTLNPKGYKVLNNVGIIQGDGIDLNMCGQILNIITNAGWSAENVSFGCGGGLLQKMSRDTIGFASKCSYIETDKGPREVFKSPIESFKASLKGKVRTFFSEGIGYICSTEGAKTWKDVMRPVYNNGKQLIEEDFDTVRNRR